MYTRQTSGSEIQPHVVPNVSVQVTMVTMQTSYHGQHEYGYKLILTYTIVNINVAINVGYYSYDSNSGNCIAVKDNKLGINFKKSFV